MLHIKKGHIVFRVPVPVLVAFALVWILTGASARVEAQNRSARSPRANTADQPKGEDAPLFIEYKGVHIGMTTDEARTKLGEPQDKSDDQDFYVFNEKESAQVFYDKTHKTYAVSINYLGAGSSTPVPKTVLGSDLEAKPDGSMYKMVRYPKAGYWVSYSRTAGNDPLITVTMQRID